MKRLLAWLARPVVRLYVLRLEANERAESERAEIWRERCVNAERREGTICANYQARIAELAAEVRRLGGDPERP